MVEAWACFTGLVSSRGRRSFFSVPGTPQTVEFQGRGHLDFSATGRIGFHDHPYDEQDLRWTRVKRALLASVQLTVGYRPFGTPSLEVTAGAGYGVVQFLEVETASIGVSENVFGDIDSSGGVAGHVGAHSAPTAPTPCSQRSSTSSSAPSTARAP